jgi:pimeloyl-ACP methyl ester carboxylesterase
LGPPLIRVDGAARKLRLPPKTLALLVLLSLETPGIERAQAARWLFPDADDPRSLLRWHLHRLRRALPPALAGRLRSVGGQLAIDLVTDVGVFRSGVETLLNEPERNDSADVLALYRGDLGTGVSAAVSVEFDTWLYVEQDDLRRRFRRAVESYARRAISEGLARDTVGPLTTLVSVDPYFEEGHVLLVDALEQSGNSAGAAAAYARYRRVVRDELFAEPRPSLARRYETDARGGSHLPMEGLVPLRAVTVHVVEWPGSEPTILGIHGSGSNGLVFQVLAERITPDLRVVAFDLRGHGFSDKPPQGYSLETNVDDTLQLIEALGLDPVLVGHSLGGAVAVGAGARLGHRLRGLILLEGVVGDQAFVDNAASRIRTPIIDVLDDRFTGFDAYLDQMRSSALRFDGRRRSDEAERLLDRFARYELAPLPGGGFRRRSLRTALEAEWASTRSADLLGELAKVRAPVLIVQAMRPWIAGRPYFTDAIVEAQVRSARDARVYRARNCDHAELVRDPEPGLVKRSRDSPSSVVDARLTYGSSGRTCSVVWRAITSKSRSE